MPGPAAIMAALAIASLSTAFAYALYFRVLSTAGATNASLVTMLIPPGAIIMGILVLDETVLPRHLVGLALIIAGLLVTDGRIRLPRRGYPATGSIGIFGPPVAVSNTCAAASRAASPRGLPISWMPMGRLRGPGPTGTEIEGRPAVVARKAKRSQSI